LTALAYAVDGVLLLVDIHGTSDSQLEGGAGALLSAIVLVKMPGWIAAAVGCELTPGAAPYSRGGCPELRSTATAGASASALTA
jgi:hypothetical protein